MNFPFHLSKLNIDFNSEFIKELSIWRCRKRWGVACQLTLVISVCAICFWGATISYAQAGLEKIELQDILQQVYKSNPTFKAAREKLEETKELYPQARAGWLPSLDAEGNVTSSDIESSNFSNGNGATTKDVTVTLKQPIFRGGRTFAETARARNLIKAEEAALSQTGQDIFLKAVTVYSDVVRDKKLLELRRKNENILRKERDAVKERHDLGETTITDIHQAMARYNRAKAETISASSDLAASEAKFLEITGMVPPSELGKADIVFNFPDDIEDMVLMAENQNPELWAVNYTHQASEHNVDAVFRELMPQLSAFASYNKQYDPQPGIVDESETEMVGVRATLSFFQGGATRSRVREAKKSAKRHSYEIEEVKQRIRQETMRNWHLYEAAKAEKESRVSEIKATKLALEGVREESRNGERTVLDVLDAEQEAIDAEISFVRAKHNEIVAKFSLASSLGLLTPENLELADAPM